MTVGELIDLLLRCDRNKQVELWVSFDGDGDHLGDLEWRGGPLLDVTEKTDAVSLER